jgi:hypothetical protein
MHMAGVVKAMKPPKSKLRNAVSKATRPPKLEKHLSQLKRDCYRCVHNGCFFQTRPGVLLVQGECFRPGSWKELAERVEHGIQQALKEGEVKEHHDAISPSFSSEFPNLPEGNFLLSCEQSNVAAKARTEQWMAFYKACSEHPGKDLANPKNSFIYEVERAMTEKDARTLGYGKGPAIRSPSAPEPLELEVSSAVKYTETQLYGRSAVVGEGLLDLLGEVASGAADLLGGALVPS